MGYQGLSSVPGNLPIKRVGSIVAGCLPAIACLLLSFAPAQLSYAQGGASYDVVIAGGRVVDPETNLDAVRNVGINGNTIAVVAEQPLSGKRVIDAKGLVVAPGFIDLHAHGQTIAADRMQAFDGVTTSLELESGILPVKDFYAEQEETGRVLNYGASAAWTFARIAELENDDPVADLRWFQKAFSLKRWVSDAAAPEQVTEIIALLEASIKEGSIGIGINAGYAPGGGYKELLAVHELAAKYQVPTFTHVSGDFPNDPDSAAESVGDIISLTVASGSQSHICHINSSSLRDISTTRSMLLAAQKKGLPITTESYTYGASSTTIGAALFNEQARAAKGIRISNIEVNGTPLNEQTFADLRKNAPGTVVVWHFLDLPKDQEILDEAVLMPGSAIASDAMPWTDIKTGEPVSETDWPLSHDAFAHPRSAGTYTRLLAEWVRERQVMTLVEAVRKSSLIPAQILQQSVPQMLKKGRLQNGMDADIIVFNLATVKDNATFTEPFRPAVGMQYVLVNGTLVIDQGKLITGSLPGQAIRRTIQ